MRQKKNVHKKLNSKGFTLVEMIVTLTIVSILLAVTFVGLHTWTRHAEFKKCNEYAHTVYTSASLELSALELAGDLERFTERVKASGTSLQTAAQLGNGAPDSVYETGRMYAITANAGEYEKYQKGGNVSQQAGLIYELIEPYSYDKGVCNHTITIEYDSVNQSVYAVFISTRAENFVYSDDHGGDYGAYDESGTVSLNAAADYELDRSTQVRKALMLGYYCVDDLGISAAFNEGQLRITECYLDNDETLDLVVSSNSRHEEADVKYTATIYQTDGDTPLFDVTFSLMDLYAKEYNATQVQTPNVIEVSVSRYTGTAKGEPEKMYFPVSFVNNELRLTLDAVMSAQTGYAIDQGESSTASLSTSFHRFLQDSVAPDIYVSARVQQLTEDDLPVNYDQGKSGVRQWITDEEYIIGSSVVSNTENVFFASVTNSSAGSNAGIGFVRHLANIRYCDDKRIMTFQLVNDLNFTDAVIYDQNTARSGAANAMELMELHTTKAFPAIPEFSANWTLTGEKALSTQNYAINQLVLTEESIVTSAEQKDECYGMIGTNSGVVKNLSLNGSTATLGYEAVATSGDTNAVVTYERQTENSALAVRAAGILCGQNQGTVGNIDMDNATSAHLALNYTPVGSGTTLTAEQMHGIGLVCGVHDGKTSLEDIQTAGELEGYIYGVNTEDTAAPVGTDDVQKRYRYAGIGGICGFTVGEPDSDSRAVTAIGAKSTIIDTVLDFLNLTDRSSVKNTAEITGNAFVGGISGNIYLVNDINDSTTNPIIDNCSNEGLIHLNGEKADLISCGTKNADVLEKEDEHTNADNCFAGGIVGYLSNGQIKDCTSAPGVSDSTFEEQAADTTLTGRTLDGGIAETKAHAYLTQYLTGNYVGGIAGCVVTGQLLDCETTEGGYVLGNDEVGGIAGYLAQVENDTSQNRLTMTGGKELQNSCYVIGHSAVGGIVGSNHAGNVLSKCVNEGVVVGAGRNIGGIAGMNCGNSEKELATIEDCTSEVFDYDDSIFTQVSGIWQIYGDNVGGLVGLNEYGQVRRTDDVATNISSIVVGNNNVGGVFGMAGTATTFDFAHYTLNGGEVYANGDNVGGYIGVNLSAEALPSAEKYSEHPYEVRPYSVQGRYAVGGAIGANVILQKKDADVKVLLSNANAFGTVYGANAVGGIIGYQRKLVMKDGSYDTVYKQLTEKLPSDGIDSVLVSVRPTTGSDRTTIDGCETLWLTDQPVGTTTSSGEQTITITGDNAAAVTAGSYGGGILGYGCSDDTILVENCANSGDISDWQASGVTGKELIAGSIAISDLYNKKVSANSGTVLNATYSYGSMKEALGMKAPIGSFVGGIQGFVSAKTTVSGCTQTGMIYAQNGFGGIAGINLGTLTGCKVETNLGTQDSSLVGGIAALNGASADVSGCTVGAQKDTYTIEGKNLVGGLFAINEADSLSASGTSQMYANISCALDGYGVGGLNGVLTGVCLIDNTTGDGKNAQQINGGSAVGGIVGVMYGTLQIKTETVTSNHLTVDGVDKVGGVFGVLRDGTVVDSDDQTAGYQNAAVVTASNGCAGGIAGQLESGAIRQATNLEQALVTAYGENGYAGGIVASVEKNGQVVSCENQSDVTSMNSYAGGICAWNKGTLKYSDYICTDKTVSSDADSMGVIAACNEGTIDACDVTGKTDKAAVTLQGNGSVIGGIVGTNTGTVKKCEMSVNYTLVTSSEKDLTIGGAIGKNEWEKTTAPELRVDNVKVTDFNMTLLGNCAYFGGLAGVSNAYGIVKDCSVSSLTVKETVASLKGSCYGGLIGDSASTVQGCTVKNINAKVSGLYQANITLTAEQQEKLASCFGGLIGKNQTEGSISACTLDTSDGYDKNQIIVENGLVGGITGINKGMVTTSGYQASGDDSAVAIAEGIQKAISDYVNDYKKKDETDQSHIDLETEKERVGYEYLIEKNATVQSMIKDRKTSGIKWIRENYCTEQAFAQQAAVQWMKQNCDPQLLLQLTGNGSIGGVTAYNTQNGTVQYCVTGQWLIDNRSASQYSAQGGVIGTNESDQDTCFLINQAMVLRESQSDVTERVAGGVIGYQNNTTGNQWTIYGCINTGMLVNVRSHYCGGIIGRWSNQGGSIEYCRNYGVMQTSYATAWKGAAGGIVAQLYHPLDAQSYTVLSCRNDGSILGTGSNCKGIDNAANDTAGIMGNIVTYEAENANAAQDIQVNLIDCVNGPDVTIVANSMGAGIISFLTSDKSASGDTSQSRLELNIDRCRNYAVDFKSRYGYVGIFGDRQSGHEKTRITNCFTVADEGAMYNEGGYPHRGYICSDDEASGGSSWRYDGGKSAICYNNQVLLVVKDDTGRWVNTTVELTNLSNAKATNYSDKAQGTCYTVVDDAGATVNDPQGDGKSLQNMLDGKNKEYTVWGTQYGAQLYIQLDTPTVLGDLTLQFGALLTGDTHSCRVEYLTESGGGDHFTLAKEVICATGAQEKISFPAAVKIYALRIQYVRNGIDSNASEFNQYGYYYSKEPTYHTLAGLSLTNQKGAKISLTAGSGKIVSPRLVDSEVTWENRWRNGSVQYLYVAEQGGYTYLVEPLFERQRLSAGNDARTSYNSKINSTYTIVGNEIFDSSGAPYGTVYAKTTTKIRNSSEAPTSQNSVLNSEALDTIIVDHYSDTLAATMPDEEGSLLPETPVKAEIELSSDQASLDVSWENSIDGARNVVKYYLVTVTDESGNKYLSEKKCIGNSLKLDITSDMVGKKLKASVRAVNENGTSDVCTSENKVEITEPMLTPQVRLELVKSGNTYKYQVSLENQTDYKEAYGADWEVTVYKQGADKNKTKLGTIKQSNTSFTIDGSDIGSYSSSLASWQLYAQAKSTNDSRRASEYYSTSVYTPKYKSDSGSDIVPGIKTLYATFDDNYQSELDAKINVYIASNESGVGIYPVYQVDLIRVDKDNKEHILAAKELAVSTQTSTVTFSDLPEEFFDADQTQYFYVRAWVSQTGVGPVYTWHETDSLETNGSLLSDTTEEDKSYITGALLQNASAFGTRIRTTCKNSGDRASITWNDSNAVSAWTKYYAMTNQPSMKDSDVAAVYDPDTDQLSYQFSWSDASTETKSYELRIYGVSGDDDDAAKVLLKKTYPIERNGSKGTYSTVTDDWTYNRLELVVIQRDTGYAPGDDGDATDKSKVVPRALKKTVNIRTRLPKLSQPTVKLVSQNDLTYRISWQDISASVAESERNNLKYALYIESDDKQTLLTRTANHEAECDLYDYEGNTVQIYAVAYTDEKDLSAVATTNLSSTSTCFKSQVGLKKRLTVGKRLSQPVFATTPYSWSYRDYTIDLEKNVLTESQFTSNALKFNIQLTTEGNYVMNAVIFDTYDEAQTFIDGLPETPYSQYVKLEKILSDVNYKRLSEGGKPVMMSVKSKDDKIYMVATSFKDISDAGGYLVPLVRATSSTDISSYWTCGTPYQIPRVILDTPELDEVLTEIKYDSFGENLRNSVSSSGTPFTDVTVNYETYRFSIPSYVKEDLLTLTTGEGKQYLLTVSGDQVVVHCDIDLADTKATKTANSDGSYDYTYTLSGENECQLDVITNLVSGTYRASKNLRAAYRMTFDTGIRRTETDGVVTYELRLPQTRYAITCSGGISISGTSRLFTDIHIQAIPNDANRYEASPAKQ